MPAETRWSYEFYTIDRFLLLVNQVNMLVDEQGGDRDLEPFDEREVETLTAWRDVLRLFEVVTRHSEGERYASLAHVPHWIAMLRDAVRARQERDVRAQFRMALRESVLKRLVPMLEVVVCPEAPSDDSCYTHPSGVRVGNCLLAAALHPEYSVLECLDVHEKKLVWRRIEFEALRFLPPHESSDGSDWSDDEHRTKAVMVVTGVMMSTYHRPQFCKITINIHPRKV